MTGVQRVVYLYALAIGYLCLAWMWFTFPAGGGPLPPRDARARIRRTALTHAYEGLPRG